LCSSHGAGLAFVNSLALHQNVFRKLDDYVGAASDFCAKETETRRASSESSEIARSLDFSSFHF
jgi:hypothetical protein